jgi:hypothetical protein
MPTQEIQSRIETGITGWISIHINDPKISRNQDFETPANSPSHYRESSRRETPLRTPAMPRLFEHVQQMPVTFAERFPRLTFFAVAVTLLACALAAEFDYLHGAGYYWP